MKIKTMFIIFNSIVVCFMVIVGATFGIENSMRTLGVQLWGLFTLCVVVLVAFDAYYLVNAKLLSFLEKEDWPALVQYLETQTLTKGRYSSRSVRLLAQAYLILSDTASLVNLENKIALAKPRLVETYALIFGTARLLEKNMASAASFFFARIHSRKLNKADLLWLRFYYGFSMLLDWRFSEAAEEFIILTKISNDMVISGLAAWFLSDYLVKTLPDRNVDITAAIEAARKQVKEAVYDLQQWNAKVSRLQKEPHVAIIIQYLHKAGAWIFA
ncbi:MAG: hypothetical protein LBH85_02060 [Treponema sp.]|jgi:hypothetical protein|nr:hypothetical protein [Treponema sp.]